VEICTNNRTDLGYRTATDCTTLENLGLLDSNQLSQIESFSTKPTLLSTGNTPKNLHVHNCYMAEALDPESESISRKRGRNSDPSTPPTRNLTPVTIMAVYHWYSKI
jgi:hypothetical protein